MNESVFHETKMVQNRALQVLKEFKAICKKNNLRYFAIGGTCIGAIRHKGFIPWDDDIDVAMPYEDYEIFLQLCKLQLKEPFSLIGPFNMQHYASLYYKVQDSSTTFIEEFYKQFPDRYSGIYIDVFPVCGLPEEDTERKEIIQRNEKLKKINRKLRYPIDYDAGVKSRVIWTLLVPIRKILPFYWATSQQYKIIKKLPFGMTQFIWFPWRKIPGTGSGTYKNVFYYDDFKETLEVPFEDTSICVPAGYNRYLTMDFGDYMKLPPIEKQIPGHPKAIIDFNRPYEFYKSKKEN